LRVSPPPDRHIPPDRHSLALVARVIPDVAAIDKTFDYLIPDRFRDEVQVGTIVRIELHGRRVRGWVVAVGVEPPEGVMLKPIAKVTGWGPPADMVDLAHWAAWRWAGRVTALLGTASPPGAVTNLPTAGPRRAARTAAAAGGVVRVPPATDVFPHVLAAAEQGNALIVTPSIAQAREIASRLRRAGVTTAFVPHEWARAAAGATVVGARAAAWAPVIDLAAVVVVDEHDEGLQEERAPTWHARDVAIERAQRLGVPCVLLSPCPTLEARAWASVTAPSTAEERAGWPIVDVVDRRQEDPVKAGLYSDRLARWLREPDRGRVLCVLNRTGRARLLACVACGHVADCDRCGAAVVQPDVGRFRCVRCGTERPVVCRHCGGSRMKNLRTGVSRAREELEALAAEPVAEITGATVNRGRPAARIVVGTEAVLHQFGPGDGVGVIAVLDLDQELLAPRYRAAEQALGLLARAGRILGGRPSGGRLLLQTRQPKHPVVEAALHADPERVAKAERATRRTLGFPPFAALAAISGPAAPAFIEALGSPLGVDVLGPGDGRWLVRAPDHATLCDALAATPRPPGRVRVEVDPLRI